MNEIKIDGIERVDGSYKFSCINCKKEHLVSTKTSAIRTLARKRCKNCVRHYRTIRDQDTVESLGVYKNESGKWSKKCSGCGVEQSYTRKDHAKQSARANWRCKDCAQFENKTRPSIYNGFRIVDIDQFERAAESRDLIWDIDIDNFVSLWESQKGLCALSGLPMQKNPKTWSIDRIDNDRGYTKGNVHLVLTHVNMMRGKYSIEEFIQTAKAIAAHNA